LNEVTQELQERVHRWKQIELLCGFNIINNSGLQYLESVLYRGTANGRGSVRGRMNNSQDDLDDETSSLYSPSAGCLESLHWKEGADSSGSDTGKQDLDDDTHSSVSNVQFTVGDSWAEENEPKSLQSQLSVVQSDSHDTTMTIMERDLSQSETCLDASHPPVARVTPVKKTSLTSLSSREQPPGDDETYSTDSNSTTDEDPRRKKRKLFPAFVRKHKSKTS